MKIDKFLGSKFWYVGNSLDGKETIKYYRKSIEDGIKWAHNPVYTPADEAPFVNPLVVLCKNGKVVALREAINNHAGYDADVIEGEYDETTLIDEIEARYGVENVKTEYVGVISPLDTPVFLCVSWSGAVDTEEYDTVEIAPDDFDSIEIGSTLYQLLDFRGYNYRIWAAILYQLLGKLPEFDTDSQDITIALKGVE